MSSPLQTAANVAGGIQRVKYTHDAMIDVLIARPGLSQGQLAKEFGYSEPWISRIINSDSFQARLAERKSDLIDPSIVMSFDEKLRALADQSLEKIMEKIAQPVNMPGVADAALKALDMSTRALGYGAKAQNVGLQQNFVVAMPAKVMDPVAWAEMGKAAGAMAGARPVGLERVQEVTDVEPRE